MHPCQPPLSRAADRDADVSGNKINKTINKFGQDKIIKTHSKPSP